MKDGEQTVMITQAIQILRLISAIIVTVCGLIGVYRPADGFVSRYNADVRGKYNKYLTFSLDDGILQDARAMEIMIKYGLNCCTFFVNASQCGQVDDLTALLGVPVDHSHFTKEQLKDGIYDGFEVECHSYTHPDLTGKNGIEVMWEITRNKMALENLTGQQVIGHAYPGGSYDERVIKILHDSCGIHYARTVNFTDGFALPERFMEWGVTTTFTAANLMTLAEEFVAAEPEDEDLLFYVFGHSFEFDNADAWDAFEQFCAYISGRSDILYVTNGEFYELFKDDVPEM